MAQNDGVGDGSLGDSIQRLIVSGFRLHTGLTLFGIGHLQRMLDAAVGEQGLPGAVHKLESAFGELSQSVESRMDESRKEALRSVSRVSAKAVEKAFEAFSSSPNNELPDRPLYGSGHFDAGARAGGTELAVDILSGPPGD